MSRSSHVFRLSIVIVWLVVLFLYLRFEAYPTWFTKTVAGYSGLLSEDILTRESWGQILINEQPAGFVHNLFVLDDDGPSPIQEITTRMQMRVKIVEQIQNIRIFSKVDLDQDYKPIFFSVAASANHFSFRITGEHLDENRYAIKMHTAGNETERVISIPQNTILYNPVYETALRDMKPGHSVSMQTLDPFTLETAKIVVTAGATENIMIDGKQVSATPLSSRWRGMEFKSWTDQDGQLIKQETPLGWSIIATTQDHAMRSVSENNSPPSLLSNSLEGLNILRMLIGNNSM